MSCLAERILVLNSKSIQKGLLGIYWMQQSQRVEFNHALAHAVTRANELNLPLAVVFVVTPRFPEANQRSYDFMLKGLSEVKNNLEKRGISFHLFSGDPVKILPELTADSAFLITDRGYLRIQKKWRSLIAQKLECLMEQVESDVVVPLETVSFKEEYAAATLRPKILKQVESFLEPVILPELKRASLGCDFFKSKSMTPLEILSGLKADSSVFPVTSITPGYSSAVSRLEDFIEHHLENYAESKNDPGINSVSSLSPYLHFGQISPLEIALKVKASDSKGSEVYLEELIVRRELAMNFVNFNPQYDSYPALPLWGQKTLKAHEKDPREYLYSLKELENARTHDPFWNAAQTEMVLTGKMQGYMRMYWGKKVLEWTEKPEKAFEVLLYLNNKYSLDGRDPNGFAGVAWCFGKHDRPWKERRIFGHIRYMNDKGLIRKFDMEVYLQRVRALKGF